MKRRSFLKKSVLTGIMTATAPVLASSGINPLPKPIKPSGDEGLGIVKTIIRVKPVQNNDWIHIDNDLFNKPILFLSSSGYEPPRVPVFEGKIVYIKGITISDREPWKCYEAEVGFECRPLNLQAVRNTVGCITNIPYDSRVPVFVCSCEILIDNTPYSHYNKISGYDSGPIYRQRK